MAEIFIHLLNMSINASWLILAVIILRILLKKAPKWIICLMWCLVGIRLLIPVSIESMFSLIPRTEVVSEDILYDMTPAIDSGMTFVNQVVNPILQEKFSPKVGVSVNPLQVLTYVVANVWILGMAALLVYTLATYVQLRKRVGDAIRLNSNIYQSEKVGSPFVLGVVKPRIYVPFDLTEEELNCVIAHEQAHIMRRDHLLKPIAFLVLTVYWFNPLVWVAYILLCRDIEFACDEKVLKKLGKGKKKIYSEALLRVSISGDVSHKMIAACPIAFGEVGVKSRIKGVLSYKKPAFWIVIVALLACAVCLMCFMTNPKEDGRRGSLDDVEVTVSNAEKNVDGEETVKEQILQSPPSMILRDALSSTMEYFEVISGTYSWSYPSKEEPGMMTSTDAEGRPPAAAVKGQEWLHLKEYNGLDYAAYMLSFEVMPDRITVRDFDLLELGDMEATVISETSYEIAYEELFALELRPRRIYEVIAEWDQENLEGNGFFGTASYAFATDDYMPEAEAPTEAEQAWTLGDKFNEEVNNLNGVTMYMEKYKQTEGNVEFYNDTDKEYQFGERYDIQVQKDGEWYSLQTETDMIYKSIAYRLKAGSGVIWEVNWEYAYGALPEGKYRIVKDVDEYRAPGDYTKYYLAAEFEIKPVN